RRDPERGAGEHVLPVMLVGTHPAVAHQRGGNVGRHAVLPATPHLHVLGGGKRDRRVARGEALVVEAVGAGFSDGELEERGGGEGKGRGLGELVEAGGVVPGKGDAAWDGGQANRRHRAEGLVGVLVHGRGGRRGEQRNQSGDEKSAEA